MNNFLAFILGMAILCTFSSVAYGQGAVSEAAPVHGAPAPATAAPPYIGNKTAPNEKWSVLSLILEIFPSFGVGHYYAGNNWWGLAGTISNLVFYVGLFSGMGSGDGDRDRTFTYTMLAIGGAGKLITLLAAPVVTYRTNREKRRRYNLFLQQRTDLEPLRIQGLRQSSEHARRFTPFSGSHLDGKTLLFPVLALSF
ncbi:hypothetical protein KKF84_09360 [Myxococcota bacterium]|nr:hypothetical protein [Myxococcota bacterium]MBU1535517.1 hypothetical protein [Myxococcota bacterium]